MVSFSLANGTSDFYIEQKTGEVFLVPVPGHDTVQSRCNDTGCYLLVRASLQGVSDELSLVIRTVTEDKILVLDIKKPVSDAQIVLDELNSASENYWFRMLNVQPRSCVRSILSIVHVETDQHALLTPSLSILSDQSQGNNSCF